MKVYILFRDKYEGREIEGVYPSLKAAQERFPDIEWQAHIEEHEVNGWATGGKVETYDDWKQRSVTVETEVQEYASHGKPVGHQITKAHRDAS